MFLFVANDVGPASYLALIAASFGDRSRYIASSTSLPAFRSKGIIEFTEQEQGAIRAVMTGTCIDRGIDKDYILKSREWGVPSLAVIEHWTWYRKRFMLGNELILPDYIGVNDEMAKIKSIAEGLPVEKIIVLGNPVLENAFEERKPFGDSLSLRKKYDLDPEKPVLVFVSETLRDDFPVESANYLGFDEFGVLRDIIGISQRHGFQLLVKLHPSEALSKFQSLAKSTDFKVFSDMPKEDIFAISDVMIGMGSMLLLEASVAGVRKVVAYRPHETMPFIGNEIGATTPLHSKDELSGFFSGKMSSITKADFGASFAGSTMRIHEFLKAIAR